MAETGVACIAAFQAAVIRPRKAPADGLIFTRIFPEIGLLLSQRDFATKPRVARYELPGVMAGKTCYLEEVVERDGPHGPVTPFHNAVGVGLWYPSTWGSLLRRQPQALERSPVGTKSSRLCI